MADSGDDILRTLQNLKGRRTDGRLQVLDSKAKREVDKRNAAIRAALDKFAILGARVRACCVGISGLSAALCMVCD